MLVMGVLLRSCLSPKAQFWHISLIYIQTHLCLIDLKCLLIVSLQVLKILFALNHSQFLLLDPFSVDIALFSRTLSLSIIWQINTLCLIVFLKSKFFRFRCLFFYWSLLGSWFISGLDRFSFLALLGILIWILLVFHVTDITVSSSSFSRSVSE